ncbi:MAG: hypothetical protein ACPGQL_06175, partial [Thermoplasmatota archaeon]
MACTCGAQQRMVTFAHRHVTTCQACHKAEADWAVSLRTPTYRDHLRCLQQEIMEAQKNADEATVTAVVQEARLEGPNAWLRVQVTEGDP